MTNTLARKIGNNIKMNLFSEVDYLRGSSTPSECAQLVPVVWQINYLQTTLRLKYSILPLFMQNYLHFFIQKEANNFTSLQTKNLI